VYASGFNTDLARAKLAERHDYRIGALLLALGFLVQLSSVAMADPVHSVVGAVLAAVGAITVSLAIWRVPRRFIVECELARLTAHVTRDWK
jgi:hypothetical protein